MRLDQPAEGRDHETKHNAAHMLGKSNTTGRDSYLFFGKMARADADQVENFRYAEALVSIECTQLKGIPNIKVGEDFKGIRDDCEIGMIAIAR